MSDIFDHARRIESAKLKEAEALRDHFVEHLRKWMDAEKDAQFVKGVIFGVQNGLSALDKLPVKAEEQLPLEVPEAPKVVQEQAKRRRAPGHNENIVSKILDAHAITGIRIPHIREYAVLHFGEELADSSTRKALMDLQSKDRAVEIDSAWFPGDADGVPGDSGDPAPELDKLEQ